MMSDHDNRPDADTCGDCGRRGRDRDGCNCIRDAFNDLVRTELAGPRPMCECKCNGLEPHADRRCNRHATVLVALHMWGICDRTPAELGVVDPSCVDENGNMTSYMCGRCADHAEAVARRNIGRLAVSGSPMVCPGCGKATVEAADIFERRSI